MKSTLALLNSEAGIDSEPDGPGLKRRHLVMPLEAERMAKGDRDAALIEIERVNAVDGRQLGLAPI